MFGRRSPRSRRNTSDNFNRGRPVRRSRRSPVDSQPARPRTSSISDQKKKFNQRSLRALATSKNKKPSEAEYHKKMTSAGNKYYSAGTGKVLDPRKYIFNQIARKKIERYNQDTVGKNTVGPDYSVPPKRRPLPEPIKETKTYAPLKRMPRPEPIKETKTYTPRTNRMSKGGMPTKNAKGHNDYRKTGTTLSVKDNRKNK